MAAQLRTTRAAFDPGSSATSDAASRNAAAASALRAAYMNMGDSRASDTAALPDHPCARHSRAASLCTAIDSSMPTPAGRSPALRRGWQPRRHDRY